MEGNNYNNWQNYGQNNRRQRNFNNPYPRPRHSNDGNMNGDLPRSYSSNGNRQSNSYYYHERRGQFNSQKNTKSFSPYRSAPYNRSQQFSQSDSQLYYSRTKHFQESLPTTSAEEEVRELSPLEAKIEKLMHAVMSQKGVTGQLVFLQTELENPTVVLQNAVQSMKNSVLNVLPRVKSTVFELTINGEKFAEGVFGSKQVAKNQLCEEVVNNLKKKCFYIIKKRNYEEISTEDLNNAKKEVLPANSMQGSKAHQMMLKMGWGGKGLGSKEQGNEKTVAETLTQNITKEGLGGKNIMTEIHSILESFAISNKVTTLAFDSGFTKDERAHIHTLAQKFNLKSKSEGKDENRRITVSKKISRWDLVKELLMISCENDSYKLLIPSEFEYLWTNE